MSTSAHSSRLFVFTKSTFAVSGSLLLVACGDAATSAPPDTFDTDPDLHVAAAPLTLASLPTAEAARVQSYLDSFYTQKDIVHSFNTVHGEQIDCIPLSAQPSVKAMLARGMKATLPIPPAPPGPPPGPPPFDGSPDENGNARSCPADTVPQHRPSLQTIEDAGGVVAFQARAGKRPHPAGQLDCVNYTTPGNSWDHAAGYQYLTYQGALTFTSVWNPYVEYPAQEHSLSQLWAIGGTCEFDGTRGQVSDPCNPSNAVQSLEVGWMVGANDYTSASVPVLFTFVTQDGYFSKNCYGGTNKGSCCGTGDCFIPANGAQYVLGTQFTPSTVGNVPNEIAIQVWNGSAQGYPAWYIWINGYLIGGYLTSSTYTGQMQTAATYLQVGGEVYDAYNNNEHTATYMGSGYENPSPIDGVPQNYEWTAYHRHVSTIDSSSNYHDASLTFANGNTGICGWQAASYYGLGKSPAWAAGPTQTQWPSGFGTWNEYFYFGGPGE
jgi:Neprosin